MLTMKQKGKRLEYVRQYQTMSKKNGKKLFSQTKRNSIEMVQMAFKSNGMQKFFQKRITQQDIMEEDLL